jgi:hypothetical protein
VIGFAAWLGSLDCTSNKRPFAHKGIVAIFRINARSFVLFVVVQKPETP